MNAQSRACALLTLLIGCDPASDKGDDTSGGDGGAGGPNTPPSAATVALSPDRPTSAQDVAVVIISEASDPDGDPLAYRYLWFADGALRADLTGATLPAAETSKGQVWTVNVVANDGVADGPAAAAEATVVNAPPSVSVSIDGAPATDDVLVALAVGADADGDAVSLRYAWTVDGAPTTWTTSAVPASETRKGQRWEVTVTPNDGEVDGAPVSAAVEVANTPPSGGRAVLSPAPAYEDTVLLVAVEDELDPDGDPVTPTTTWFVNGAAVDGATGDFLTGAHFDKGDAVVARVELRDPSGPGAVIESDPLIISNSLPAGASASISPAIVLEATGATCLGAGWVDGDGDAEGWEYAWLVNGSPAGSGATLTGAHYGRGDSLVCTATPVDGEGRGSELRAPAVVVSNTPPTLAGVGLSTAAPTESDTLSAVLGTVADDDGDPVTLGYAWSVNGVVVSTAATLPPSLFRSGDTIFVTVTPHDGIAAGVAARSGAAVVVNSLPVIGAVTISPSLPTKASTLSANLVGAFDADGDSVTMSYAWRVNGAVVSASPTLGGAAFNRGDVVDVIVTPADATGSGAAVTSGAVVIQNSRPAGGSVRVDPSALTEASTATCTPSGWTDADGDPAGWRFQWRVNGAAVSTAAAIDGALFSRGDSVLCVVTPDDGITLGSALTAAAVVVANTPPTLASAALSTTSPTEADTLSVSLGAMADIDGDTVTPRYAWSVNGVSVSTSPTLPPSAFGRGDVVVVTVTPHDGAVSGVPVTAAPATVVNSLPTISALSLSPSTLTTNSTATASATTSDADGDTVTVAYAWRVNGAVVPVTAATLSGGLYFDKGDTVEVTATPSDGAATGASRAASLVVQNSLPSAPVVGVTPEGPFEGDGLVCAVLTPATDADGDSLSYAMSWEVDGVAFTGADTGTWPGDTVPEDEAFADEVWTCAAVALDGDGAGSAGEDSVLVAPFWGDGAVSLTASGIDFVTVVGNRFDMGCTPGVMSSGRCPYANEVPVMPVTLTHDYYLSRTEVTQAQFHAVMGYYQDNRCGPSCPVTLVTWHEAAAFANAVSAAAGLASCYTCTGSGYTVSCTAPVDPYACPGYRLPTEAEWEGAARCGQDLLYAGSDTPDGVAWYNGNSDYYLQAVAGKAPNACGLYDMSGNGREWVHDWYGATYYTSAGRVDPAGPATGTARSMRGGHYSASAGGIRVSTRGDVAPGVVSSVTTIRLGRTAD